MSMGGGGGSMADINVTPMIDILLVLLIIFMVIVPVTPKGLDALVPQPPKTQHPENEKQDRTIVVQILHRGMNAPPMYKINETDVSKGELLPRLTDIYANRAERVMFVKGDDKIDFRYVAEVIDIGRSAGVDHIGLMTPKILAGQ
jgi:biopolymer transport protein ExbD